LNKAFEQFLEDAEWGELDYLLIDMPPGTGDVQMGLARMLPQALLLVVTTPAEQASKVAARTGDMARKELLEVAGVVENLSYFICDHGEPYELFGQGGGIRLASKLDVPLLARIPLDSTVQDQSPALSANASGRTTTFTGLFDELANKIIQEIAPPNVDHPRASWETIHQVDRHRLSRNNQDHQELIDESLLGHR